MVALPEELLGMDVDEKFDQGTIPERKVHAESIGLGVGINALHAKKAFAG